MSGTAGDGPGFPRRRLRAELRGLRLACGLSLEEVSERLRWPSYRLPEIEDGEIGLFGGDLTDLLAEYGIRDAARLQALHEQARISRDRMWWHPYQKLLPAEYTELISAESDAARITHFHPTFVPGLLQTRPYAVAITPPTTLKAPPPGNPDARVDVRMRRQQEMLHGPNPAELIAIVDETVLRRRVGADAVMRGQLDHLVQWAAHLVVVPVDAGPHPGLLGPFMLILYDDQRIEDVLCFEWARGNAVVRNSPDLIADYRALADRLLDMGLRGNAAIPMIEAARRHFE